jgi:hypothetical protein
VTEAEERYWREQGPDAINAEMERRIAVWLAKKRRDAQIALGQAAA